MNKAKCSKSETEMRRFAAPRLGMAWRALGFILLSCLLGTHAWSQGFVRLSNRVTTSPSGRVYAPIYKRDPFNVHLRVRGNSVANGGIAYYNGPLLMGSGTGGQAILYAGPAGVTNEDQLVAVTGLSMGAVQSDAGFFNTFASDPQSAAIPGIPAGGQATFQVRAWRSLSAFTWSQVQANPSIARGKSRLFTPPMPLGSASSNAALLVGLESFCLYRPPGTPLIEGGPSNTVGRVGESLTFNPGVDVEVPSALQWRREGNNLVDATNQWLTLSILQFTDAGNYSLQITSTAGDLVSSEATLTIPPVLFPPVFVSPGVLRLQYENTPGRTVDLQTAASPLGLMWNSIGIRTNSSVRGEFLDSSATNSPRYYRLQLIP